MRLLRLAGIALSVVMIGGCGGGGGDAPPTTPSQSGAFSLTTTTATATANRGAEATFVLSISRAGGYAGDITLAAEDVPSGVTASFAPSVVLGNATSSALRLIVSSAATPGVYSIRVRATGADVTAQLVTLTLTVPEPNFTLVPSASSIALPQTRTREVFYAINRQGGLSGNIDLSITGLPPGVAGAFTPHVAVPGQQVLTLVAVETTVPGTYNAEVTATAGALSKSAPLAVVVEKYGITYSNIAPISVQAGSTARLSLPFTRSGGFDGVVGTTLNGLPGTFVISLTEASAAQTSTSLVLSVPVSVAPGQYNGTLVATLPGLMNVIIPVQVDVTPTIGQVSVAHRFCVQQRVPLYFAYRDGQAGPFIPVAASAGNIFNFDIKATTGSTIMVHGNGTTQANVTVQHGTRAELVAAAAQECVTARVGKVIQGVWAGIATRATLGIGFSFDTMSNAETPNIQIGGVQDGPVDLLAFGNIGASHPDRAILRRAINVPTMTNIGSVNFSGAEPFNTALATFTVSNMQSDAALRSWFRSATTQFVPFPAFVMDAGPSRTYAGIPDDRLQPGDLHRVEATTAEFTSFRNTRTVTLYTTSVVPLSATFGPPMASPPITYPLQSGRIVPRVVVALQPEYKDHCVVGFTTTGRTLRVSGSAAYFGTATQFDLSAPDLSQLPQFASTWYLADAPVTNTTQCSGVSIGELWNPVTGQLVRSSFRQEVRN